MLNSLDHVTMAIKQFTIRKKKLFSTSKAFVVSIVRDPHHRESPTRREQVLNLHRT